uniref:FERM N-terminal domain-containing protein n=1 Tax=Ditylenchus dipsaci TaxID=166011 RepID=A0A915ERU5_9BILA
MGNKSMDAILFDELTKAIGLRETWYFGLQYINNKEVSAWLKLDKKVLKQDLRKGLPLHLKFRAKFFPESVEDEIIQDVTLVLLGDRGGILKSDAELSQNGTFGTYIGYRGVASTDINFIQAILSKYSANFQERPAPFKLLSYEPLNLDMNVLNLKTGARWKKIRGLIMPTFFTENLRQFGSIFDDSAKQLCHYLESFALNDSIIDLNELMDKMAMKVALKSFFSYESDIFGNDASDDEILSQLRGVFIDNAPFVVSLILAFPNLTAAIRQWTGHQLVTNSENYFFLSFLGRLLDIEKLVMCYANVGKALSIATHLLAENQDAQDKLREEISNILGGRSKCTYQDAAAMTYMKQVINEILRLYPVVPRFSRFCSTPIVVGGIAFTEGQTFTLPVFALHRDPRYYRNPYEFNPERFSEEENAKRPKFTFLPFGYGHRQCVGYRFSMLEMSVIIANLVKCYRFTTVKDSESGLFVRVTRL